MKDVRWADAVLARAFAAQAGTEEDLIRRMPHMPVKSTGSFWLRPSLQGR